MTYTVLDMVQLILSSMDSDEVNSISDTVESSQVAKILRTAFYDLFPHLKLASHSELFQLTASGDSDKPVLMTKPDNVHSIEWVKYNKETLTDTDANFQYVSFLPLNQFLEITDSLRESDSTTETLTQTVGDSDIVFQFRNDRAPNYYTTYDDTNIIFDSYDSEVDTTLQSSKTRCYGEVTQTFTLSDNFTPNLDDRQFSLLLNEAKSLAFAELKQTQHSKAEMNSRNGRIRAKKHKRNIPQNYPELWTMPGYGRMGSQTISLRPRSWSS